jgi:hypoxanthine phosphoribosyltransferase
MDSRLALSDKILRSSGHEELCGKWKLIMTEELIDICVKYLAFLLNRTFKGHSHKIVIAGILKGVCWVFSDLTKQLQFDHSVYFIDASSYHGQEQGKVNIVNEISPEKFKDKTVILLDELFDKGITMHTVSEFLRTKQGVERVFTCALWSKKTENQLQVPDFLAFKDLPSVWLVGYGLDDNGEKRNWTDLFAAPKPPEIEKTEDDCIFWNEIEYMNKSAKISLKVMEMVKEMMISSYGEYSGAFLLV